MKLMNTITRYKLHHLIFWLALLGLWYFFRYEDFHDKSLAFTITLLKVADLAFMVYLTNYLLIPQLLYKKRYVLFAISFIVLVFCSSWLKMYLEGQLMHNPQLFNLFTRFKVRFYDNVIPHFLLVSTGAGFKLLIDYARAQKKMGEMAKANAEAELNFLKSQINPHFVFNSLNSVYFLIDKKNKDARDALHKFSGMLRYQLYECNGNKTSIEKELGYLEDYIAMQRLRNENCSVNFYWAPGLKGVTIEPLLLMPFVENAFKHLSHFDNGQPNEVSIDMRHTNGTLLFTVNNTCEPDKKQTQEPGGIGLKNVQRRLELLYPGKHNLTIKNGGKHFNVVLQLQV
ncbi:sensor histidine kinase [Foetidibacter luteolus]|uniref:sensor histidine kinase n=1 Tax=Foetidibacter luteolus TaxID=2608880 RepID=UPI00129BEB56|nr:sensor histidine kinase [Foetidibacter luteolus]